MSYFIRAWVSDGQIITVLSNSIPITFNTYQGACDFKVDAEVEGEQIAADVVHASLLLTGQVLSGLPILSQEVLPGFVPPVVPPVPITFAVLQPWQWEAALEIAGLSEQVDAAIAAIADPATRAVVRAKRQRATTYSRTDPEVLSLSAGLGLTTQQVDDLWNMAASL